MGQWIEKVGPYRYKAVADADLKEFSETDIEILEKVIEHYGKLSGQSLSELSHKYPEWKKYKGMLSDKNAKNSFPIDMDLMFENSDEDNSPLFGQSQELLEETKEIFHEFNRIY